MITDFYLLLSDGILSILPCQTGQDSGVVPSV